MQNHEPTECANMQSSNLHDQDNSAANCFLIPYIFALKINLHTAG